MTRQVPAIVVLTALAALPACAAEADPVDFDGRVIRDDGAATRFRLTLPAGESTGVLLDSGLRVDLVAADDGTGTVRLLDEAGRRLHETDADAARAPFAYLVCGGEARFVSPVADAAGLRCE
ncbi:hypothetical protein [Coralloluteibacterium stylophorae]|uniref:Lipoprotein n=1 Tax=Coralloluteibacterium stylophorae TaxID=1776034 RepID=A0A8J8AXN2_9GAMM|nr:hypothetical protein [Coralloluteibacterium stylophorae]MBS7458656.1 hypothetical protein [Coralloluteibacterium stylophorae]